MNFNILMISKVPLWSNSVSKRFSKTVGKPRKLRFDKQRIRNVTNMGSLFQDMLGSDGQMIDTNVDIVFVIDATESMQPLTISLQKIYILK